MGTRMKESSMDKRKLYELIVNQLEHDGYYDAAKRVTEATFVSSTKADDKDSLFRIVKKASQSRKRAKTSSTKLKEFEQDKHAKNVYPEFDTRFITTHKQSCRVAAFSKDGQLVATGSEDTSLKLIDVKKMKEFNKLKVERGQEGYYDARPVIRTFYDHADHVYDVDFHPSASVLASCSKDKTIKLFDYQQQSKRAYRYLPVSHPVRSISFHPSGDFILAGTTQPMIRLYDVAKFTAYVNPDKEQHHSKAINQVRYCADGKAYVSCSADGNVKVWDTTTNKCVRTFTAAHTGAEVSSCSFSKNGKFVLSGGKDSTVRLWDVGTGKQVRQFNGIRQTKIRTQTCFSHNEDFIYSGDEATNNVYVWDTLTGQTVQKLTGHTSDIKWIAPSPVEYAVITCSSDFRARFWVAENKKLH